LSTWSLFLSLGFQIAEPEAVDVDLPTENAAGN
jgi:hypothetical protein